MDGYGPETYGDGFADVYDEWYGDVSDVSATVDGLVALAEGGPVLELGVGTGRLALPLADRGLTVIGVDASTAMLDRLRAKPGADRLELHESDMSGPLPGAGRFAVVLVAFNTFFNLTDTEAQARCLHHAAEALRPGGRLVIEGFVPPAEGLTDGGVSVREVTVDRAVLSVSQHDPGAQLIRGHHVDISHHGIRMRPWMLHYRTPTQLDEATAAAGFTLEWRATDWTGTPFSADSDAHVSVYRLTPGRR